MAYKAKLNSGTTHFQKDGFKVSWASASQKDLKKVYELGYTKFVEKLDKDDKKAPKKSSQKQTKVSDKQDEQQD